MNIICLDDNYYLKQIEKNEFEIIFKNTDNFPLEGWFHKCSLCGTVTTKKYYLTRFEDLIFNLLLCRGCGEYYPNRYKKEREKIIKKVFIYLVINKIL